MIIMGQDQTIAPWVEGLLGEKLGPSVAVGFATQQGLQGAVVYHSYREQYKSVEASIASISPRWATKEAIRFMFWLPFVNMGVERIQTAVRKKNRHAVTFNRRLGLVYEGKGRKAFGDDDALVYSILKEEWKASKWFIGDDNEQEFGQRASG